ncbi:MAG: hypothetical protein IH899_22445 [Planctomycetes bacterium]|nr:hypothetical protein [Planctomycetota bacterium]
MNQTAESVSEQITRDESGQHEIRLLEGIERIVVALERLADHFAPAPPDVVGTPYVARKLACTTVWITDMIRRGEIPRSCIVPGTGNGKLWKLYRRKIDKWIETR